MVGQVGLGGFWVAEVREPPHGREQHELDVRELVRRQRPADPPLPGERGAPEKEAWALLRRVEPRLGELWRYDSRSFARATREAIVRGKSAVISGPIW